MRDSILKGTGNSRFLKSVIPDGTTWAEALAMLRAGTFPMDLNGINSAGFQQVGTPLNKANLLKDVNALTLGLTGDAVPNDMFNVLAHAGDLHVWRKTVVNASEKPAGYTLGVETTKTLGLTRNSDSSYWAITVELASSVSVDYAGNVTLVSPSNLSVYAYNGFANSFSGKFFRLISVGSSVTGTQIDTGDIYFVPSGNKLIIRADASGSKFYLDLGMKLVTGYAKTPAGTTVTYPVSTNRNAYREGSDAKPAGYTLGDVVTGSFKMSECYPTYGYYYKYANSISVADNGIVSLDNPSQISFDRYNGGQSYADRNLAEIAGKFIYLANRGSGTNAPDSKPPFNSVPSAVVYIPSDAALTWTEGGALDGFTLSRYQPVTGYAAIPAGTTIEYLGCLGDKAMVQVVSYVGTGTYGSSNPNSLTFDFAPSVVRLLGEISNGDNFTVCSSYPVNANHGFYSTILFTEALTTIYAARLGFSKNNYTSSYCKISQDGKTVTWYNDGSDQINTAGYTYYFLAIG